MSKKRRRKPPGFWNVKENQKAFLDSLIKKYRIIPAKITSSILRANKGRGLSAKYRTVREMIEAHYGPVSLMDLPRVPDGTWAEKSNRIKTVHEAVRRLGKRPDRVMYKDFIRLGLGGMMKASGKPHYALLREAGYEVPDPVEWKDKKARIRKVRELVEKAGGPLRVTNMYFQRKASGLLHYYFENFPKAKPRTLANLSPVQHPNAKDPYIPLLYWILKDAGYDVTPEDCERSVWSREPTPSRHGDLNHSRQEAMIDDWIFDIVGPAHVHDIVYPGQEETPETSKMDCDFVLLPAPTQSPNSPTIHSPQLWVEFAGMVDTGKVSEIVKEYRENLKKKKALAEEARIQLIIITPEAIADNPEKVWEEIATKAPWLKPKTKKALGSRFLELF